MKNLIDYPENMCKLCDGSVECAPTAILLISLIHALYGYLGPEPDYFRHKHNHSYSHAKRRPGHTHEPQSQTGSVVEPYKRNYEDETQFPRDDSGVLHYRRSRSQSPSKITDGMRYRKINHRKESLHSDKALDVYDFIIIGGGTAGCVLASRLSENRDWRVLLIEAGPEQPKLSVIPGLTREFVGSSVDWKYAMRPNNRFCQNRRELGCEVIQGRVLGGTSSINDMAYVRGSSADFDEWALLGNDGWSYSKVLPYFKHSEGNYDVDPSIHKHFHNRQGPLDVGWYPYADQNVQILISGLGEMGFNITDINGRTQLGVTKVQSTTYMGERVSSYTAFLEPVRQMRPNLDILTLTLVTKILTEGKGEHVRAVGVEMLANGTIFRIRAKKEIILSAGAINSPKILMQSGIGPRDYLEYLDLPVQQDLPVGGNLQDHVSVCLPVVKLSKTSTTKKFQEKIKDITGYYEKANGPLSANFQVIAFYETTFSDILGAPDIEIRFRGHNSNMYFDRMDMCISLLTPSSKGEILLNATDPVFGKPLIYPNFLKNDVDIRKLVSGLHEMIKIFDTEPLIRAGITFDPYPLLNNDCKTEDHVSERFWACVIKYFSMPLHNYVGTCKMGPINDPESVVDQELKVYGVKHLRIVDASVFPKITRGSTAASVIMVAEKGSDMIKDRWY